MRRTRTVLLALALVLGLLPAASGAQNADDAVTSDNMEFVTNLKFDKREDLGSSSRLATDVDFASYVVTPAGELLPPEAVTPDPAMPPLETREFAFVGTYVNGLQVVDVTDPEAPEVVAVYECAIAQSDVFAFTQEDDDRVFLAYTSDVISGQTNFSSRCHTDNGVRPGQYGTFLVDVTNPYDPQSVSFVPYPRGTHQVTIHPSGEWIYSSPAALGAAQTGQIDITDISDPWNPVTVEPLELVTGLDSHDLSFNAEGTRAYSAALTHTLVIDTSDPGEPEIIGRILDPAVNIHHEAHAVDVETPLGDRTYLLVGDEIAGAAGNGACPGGGIHVYDISGPLESAPVKVGVYFMPETGATPGAPRGAAGTIRCTAHVMQVLPEQQQIVMGWYAAGVRVLDYSGLAGVAVSAGAQGQSLGVGMTEIGYGHFADSDTWAAKTNGVADDGSFYVFGIDTYRELDMWKFTPDGAAESGGRWLSPSEALAQAPPLDLLAQPGPYCVLR